MAQWLRRAMSQAVDRLLELESPWEFAYFVFVIPKLMALWFISFRNQLQQTPFVSFFSNIYISQAFLSESDPAAISLRPPQTARARLASFPLGSISPQSSWRREQIWPGWMQAEVPPMLDSYFPIFISSWSMSTRYLSASSIVRMQVIIFVREATSCEFLLLKQTTGRIPSVSTSQTMQLFAVSFGGGLKGRAQLRFISFFFSSFSLLSSSAFLSLSTVSVLDRLNLMLFPLSMFPLTPSPLLWHRFFTEFAVFETDFWPELGRLFASCFSLLGSYSIGATKFTWYSGSLQASEDRRFSISMRKLF